jgi:hypothetical protein
MTEYKYGKAYARKQFDGSGTRFRTDGTKVEIEIFFPLNAKDVDTNDLIFLMRDKAWHLTDCRTSIVDLVHGNAPDEQYLVVSGWTAKLNTYERELASALTFH